MAGRHRTGADELVESLLSAGTEVIFGYPGGAIMPVYDALHRQRGRLRHVLVRHEQGAVHNAQGYARIRRRPGICMGTSGPGATNLLTGLADAMMDSTPIIAITGQVSRSMLGTDAFQEADVVGMSLPATKWSYQITDPNEVAWAVETAWRIATEGRPGPVLLDITKDAQQGVVTGTSLRPPDLSTRTAPIRSDALPEQDLADGIGRAAALLNAARRPLVLAGQGVLISGAEAALADVLERGRLPCACTLLGLSALPVDHPLYLGMLGMHGNYGPNLLTNEADVLLAVGMRFDDRVTGRIDGYAPGARIIHIEIDPAEIGKVVPTSIGLACDARVALEALAPLLEPRARSEWRSALEARNREEDRVVTAPLIEARETEPPSMVQVIRKLSEVTGGRAIIVSDVGQHQMHAARHYGFRLPRSHITSGGLGTMGFALPAAIGAATASAAAEDDRPVVAVAGDGGIQMSIQELGTLMQERLPVKVVVLDNHYLGMVRQWQELFFERRYSEVAMENPDFTAICAGYRIPAERVSGYTDLGPALERMLSTPGPYLLEVPVRQEENVFPMIPAGHSVEEIRLS